MEAVRIFLQCFCDFRQTNLIVRYAEAAAIEKQRQYDKFKYISNMKILLFSLFLASALALANPMLRSTYTSLPSLGVGNLNTHSIPIQAAKNIKEEHHVDNTKPIGVIQSRPLTQSNPALSYFNENNEVKPIQPIYRGSTVNIENGIIKPLHTQSPIIDHTIPTPKVVGTTKVGTTNTPLTPKIGTPILPPIPKIETYIPPSHPTVISSDQASSSPTHSTGYLGKTEQSTHNVILPIYQPFEAPIKLTDHSLPVPHKPNSVIGSKISSIIKFIEKEDNTTIGIASGPTSNKSANYRGYVCLNSTGAKITMTPELRSFATEKLHNQMVDNYMLLLVCQKGFAESKVINLLYSTDEGHLEMTVEYNEKTGYRLRSKTIFFTGMKLDANIAPSYGL